MFTFNNLRVYQKKGFEKLAAQLLQFTHDLDAWFKNGCQAKSLLLLHKYPSKKTSIYKISQYLNLPIVNKPHPTNLIGIYFSDETFSPPLSINYNSITIKILNQNCLDISKKKVDEIHQEIFGYCTIIDPLHYHGIGIVKSDENARHDGTEILFPITEKEPKKIYQLIIDNQVENLYLDYRVCVINNEIPIFYKKFKTKENRYTNEVKSAVIGNAKEIPSEVREKILLFTQKMECDFCELDVLKDNLTNRWFIIDLNKTPYGPPAPLQPEEKKKAIQILSDSFKRNFL